MFRADAADFIGSQSETVGVAAGFIVTERAEQKHC